MRTLLGLSALVVAAAVVALVVSRGRGGERPTVPAGAVSLVGDSLNVGIEPYLAESLPGWRISHDDVVGRSTDSGLEALAGARKGLAPVVVVSLGTNDEQTDTTGFRSKVERALSIAGRGRCVVWATIWRDGAPNERFNAVLEKLASTHQNLVVVDWADLVAGDRSLLAADGVHGTPDGYARRADAVAEAVRGCAPGPTVEPAG